MREIEIERAGLEKVLDDTENRRRIYDEMPRVILAREEVEIAFDSFLRRCRQGANDANFQGVTEACVQSWHANASERSGAWWKILAEQVPPGILLLFLIGYLAGLYRYNMRLSGFHHSRADALELVAGGMVSKGNMDDFTKLALALAADSVEFGKMQVGLGAGNVSIERAAKS
ncbi:MAG: hypothetical protein AAF718_11220 [Pseudomonadota bacterium]